MGASWTRSNLIPLGCRTDGFPGQTERRVGGKAWALCRLRCAGLPVPDGFVVPVEVYQAAISDPFVLWELERLGTELEGLRRPQPETLRAQHPGIELVAGDLLARLRAEIEGALAHWRQPLPRWFAVRSSATGEDSEQHSFAGVLESFLAVSARDLPEAILLCWASAHSRRCRAYCEQMGLAPEELAVGVIVQEMVRADAAGVLLTTDPILGERSPVIDAVRGLGSEMMDGTVEPDEYHRRSDGSGEVRPGRQSWMEVLTDTGLDRAPLPPEARDRPALGPREREALVRLGRRLERLMGGPQDVEWALQEGRLWLLQARPITTLAPVRAWTRANLREVYPELPSPMTASLIEAYERNWVIDLFAARGFRVRHLRQLYALREAVRRGMTRLIGGRRRWELSLGTRWAERGWLDRPEDYFWLRIAVAPRATSF